VVIGRVKLGPFVSIWPGAVLRGDDGPIEIGAYTNIQDGTVIHSTLGLSEVVIGERVTVGHRVILHGCRVADDCLVGMGSIVLDNARVGSGAIVGAGSLVTQGREVPDGMMAFGNPLKLHRPTGEKDRAWIDYSWQHYVETARRHRENLLRQTGG
jgi:carbonic anhydrase/acetyltransferase-like protein (isoleucine patch superfamily)